MSTMPFTTSYLPETPSQTAGPYVHIGLIPKQAGFEIFANNFSGDIAGPGVAGERITIEGRVLDGTGHRDEGRADRDLAGERGRPLQPSGRQAGRRARQGLPRMGAHGNRFRDRGLYHPHDQARSRDRSQGPPAHGAARQFLARLARHQHRPRDAHVFRRRGGGECGRSRCSTSSSSPSDARP